ncbi:MAG: DNA mismatch repair protein MutS, partial [Acidobacteriota bacterium]
MSSEKNAGQLTPMLRQFYEIKKQYPGTLLFFRMGDFYELFFDDAIIGAREMEITLTSRQKERGVPIPMCGIPHHAVTGYITKLVRKGFRIAICEQVEDPKSTTKLVKREVVRVVTPGTALESQLLEAKQNNYLASVCGAGNGMGLALLDLSTGEFLATEFSGESAWQKIQEQIEIFSPRELIFPNSLSALVGHKRKKSAQEFGSTPLADTSNAEPLSAASSPEMPKHAGTLSEPGAYELKNVALTPLDDWLFGFDHAGSLLRTQLAVTSLDGFGLSGHQFAVCAAGGAAHYINETQKAQASHLTEITYFESSEFLVLDATTVTNLELVAATDGVASHSLVGVLDETQTGMGARLLRQWVV